MRKNINRVLDAFNSGRAYSEGSCSTNGNEIFSYAMRIAWREGGKNHVISYYDAPSNTTRSQVHACRWALLPENEVRETPPKKHKYKKSTIPRGQGRLIP